MSIKATIQTTGTGASDSFDLESGEHTLLVSWAGTPGDADLEVGDGETFVKAFGEDGDVVNITSNFSARVPGGVSYRLYVNTHSSVATMMAGR